MALIDIKNILHDATTHDEKEHAGDVIDTAAENIGDGHNLQLFVRLASAYSSQDLDVDFNVQDSDDNESFDTVVSATINAEDMTEPRELLKFGLPAGLRRYVRLQISSSSSPEDGGEITAWIGM